MQNRILALLPTRNRPQKLKRVLTFYNKFTAENITYHILNASDTFTVYSQLFPNLDLTDYHYSHLLSFTERISQHLSCINLDYEYVIIINDEDIVLPSYLKDAAQFLSKNLDYSMYVGSVLTYLRPFLIFPRISFHKSFFFNKPFSLSDANPLLRVHKYFALNTNVIPFTFYSLRRLDDFLDLYDSCIHKLRLYEMTEEYLDQIKLALDGYIYFDNKPMIIRDETKLSYTIENNRHHPVSLIPINDLEKIKPYLVDKYSFSGKECDFILHPFYDSNYTRLLSSSGYLPKALDSTYGQLSLLVPRLEAISRVILGIINYFLLLIFLPPTLLKISFLWISKPIPVNK